MQRMMTQLLLLVAILLMVNPCDVRAQATTQPQVRDPLAARQQIVRDRMVQLEDRMYRLAERLAKTDPQQARRLEKALRESGEMLIRHHMDQAVQLLEQTDLAEAADHQAAAAKALEQILTLLIESNDESRERREEMDRVRELREQVDQLVEKQRDLRGKTDPGERLSEQLAAAAAKLQGLIDRQSGQIEDTRKAIRQDAPRGDTPRPASLAQSQAAIRQDAESLARDLEQAGATQPEAEPRESPLMHATEEARNELRDAADRMQSAEQDLGQNLPITSEPKQAKALESLQKALESLKQRERAMQPANADEATRQQHELEQQAGKLADSMSGEKVEGKQAGSQPMGSQPADSQPATASRDREGAENNPQPTSPGGNNMRQAQQHMKDAGSKLDRGQPAAATPDQDKAIDELEKARAELQEALDQLRREQQEEMLAGLEQRFRTMLLEQTQLNASTESLDKSRDKWTRTDELNLAGLAEKQTVLGGEAGKALTILREDGSSVVFPDIVAQVRDDMIDVAGRLGAKQTGTVTREVQGQIVQTLQELIAAVEQRQKDGPPPSPGQGPPGSAEGAAPLLPGSAELKLLRSCQMRVNRSTQQLDGMGKEPSAEVVDQAKRLSVRQEQLAEMARKISERAAGQ